MRRNLLLTLCLVTALSAVAQIEDYTLPDGKVIKVDRSVFPDFKVDNVVQPQPAEYVARRKARAKLGKVKLPEYVYNGETKYFPPIFNQDGGSCGSAQSVGYMFTHEINCYRDLNASLPENQYPTHFTWLLAYQTSNVETMGRGIGIPNVPTYGGRTYSKLFGSQTHDDPDYGWMQGYDKWYSAMWNKIAHSISFAPTNTPEGRQELKEWLYNHSGDEDMHGGGLAGIGVAAGPISGEIPMSQANKEAGLVGMKYVKSWGETYNHALTVCGYDDRIEFDLDEDGIIGEVNEDEVGAWIIANSWGSGWENKGFIYCPYKYSFAVGKDKMAWSPGAHILRKNYRPLRTIKLLMDYSHRSELLLCAGVSEDLNATKPDAEIPFEHFRYASNTLRADPAPAVPMLGRWVDGMHYEPMEFGYDLTDLTATVDRTKPLKYFFIVKTKKDAIGSGHIYKASIINYEFENEGIEIPFDDTNVEIIGENGETMITVIVPGEQLYPVSNLALQNKTLTWTAPQASSLKLAAYNVYDGEVVMEKLSPEQTQLTLANDAEGPFSIKAVYQAGAYTMESKASNQVMLKTPQHGINKAITFDNCGLTIPNLISTVLNEVTIEFWMRSSKNVNYNQQIGPGWGTFLFHNSANGTLSVGWENDSKNRLNISSVFSNTSKWNHIAIVIKGSKLILYVNGKKKGELNSDKFSGLTAFGNLQFGRASLDQWWAGGLDEIRVWKKARTVTEIAKNMYIPISMPALQPDLMAYLPMDIIQVNGKTLLRDWAGGKHATINATGVWTIEENQDFLSNNQQTPSIKIVEVDTTYMRGIPFNITAQSSLNAIDWTWSVIDTEMPKVKGMSPTFVFQQPGTYKISCTAQYASGETLTDSTEINVADGNAPTAAFDVLNDTLPAGDRFCFINRSVGEGCTYVWSMPGAEVEQTGGTNATALFPETGTFEITLTASNPYGTSSVTRKVTVNESAPDPRFEISNTAIILGDTIQLIDNSRYKPTSWQWELNNGRRALIVNEKSPYVVPTAPGIYDVSLQVNNELGSNTHTNKMYLAVSKEDPGTCLNFNGNERLELTYPTTGSLSGLTLEWWMRPQKFEGSVCLTSSKGNLSTSVDFNGVLTIKRGTKQVVSEENYIICNEWHHYAIIYSGGRVKFYRDGKLISTASDRLNTTFSTLGTITMGSETESLKGQIDEVRLWGTALSEKKLNSYCNNHIKDIEAAEASDKLLLYYDFNQSGGNVIDRTSSLCHAERIGFGPDGDAWNSAIGVFTLDTESEMGGDISSEYLTNYKNPFTSNGATVNPNNSSRYRGLAMQTTRSKWQDVNAIVSGNITTGGHIDTSHSSDLVFETDWNGFATPLLDYRLWQPVTLPAGKYTFSVDFGHSSDAQSSRLVVCKGDTMVSDENCEKEALAWSLLSEGSISFFLTEETEVSLGIIVNLTGQASFGIHAFKLEGVGFETLKPVNTTGITDITPSQTVIRGIYNVSGQSLKELQKGINIINGQKIYKK